MKKLLLLSAAFSVLISGAVSLNAADTFSKEQKSEIEKVVENFLLQKPEVLEKAFYNLQTKRQTEKVSKNTPALFSNSHDPFIGNPHGSKQIAVFMDPFCGACREFHKTLNQIPQDPELHSVKIIFKDLPIFGEISKLAVKAMFAAKNQGKYFDFQKAVLDLNQDVTEDNIMDIAQKIGLNVDQFKSDLSSSSIQDHITENTDLASALGIDATPTIIYGNLIIRGGPDFKNLKKIILENSKNKI